VVAFGRASFLQQTSWYGGDCSRHFCGDLHIPIKHRFIKYQRQCGMSRLHLNMKCLDRWQSVCTVYTDSKSKKRWWEWSKLQYNVHYRVAFMHFVGLFVTLEACLGWNDTVIMSCSLSKLASYKSKNLNLDWIADLSCIWTSIKGWEMSGSESYSLAMNTRAMSPYLTLLDA